MSEIESFIDRKIQEGMPEAPTVPISFRGQKSTILEADILAKVLGYSTRSKLLSDLVPAALRQAIGALPKCMVEEYTTEFNRVMEERSAEWVESQNTK